MHSYSVRILSSHPLRLILTVGGIALCITMMLFLLSVYQGVAHGSVDYIRQSNAELWVLQENATNILRGSSMLSTGHGILIRKLPGVKTASPVLLILSSIKNTEQPVTVFLAGFDLRTGLGGPPQISEGRLVTSDDEIVLDKSFATKFRFKLGDRVRIRDASLEVVGLSSGTNAFVIQYAFVSLRRAQSLIGFPSIVTCFLVEVNERNDITKVAAHIRQELPGLEVYDHQTFLENNIREMEAGFLPIFYTIATIGAIVLTAILSLLLTINILEQQKDFAVLKALGSPKGFLGRLVVNQALLISSAGSIAALFFFFPLVSLIEKIWPEVSTKSSVEQIVATVLIVAVMSFLSSLISIQRLRRIYPLEAFA